MEEEARTTLERRDLRRCSSPPKDSESATHCALDEDNPDGPVVSLLQAPGKGKGSLGRVVALHCQETAGKDAIFEHVVCVKCTPQAKILAKQFKLPQIFGAVGAALQDQARQADSDCDWTILQRLERLLKDWKLLELIIFDDVLGGEFLQRMVDLQCGSAVKTVVTSQWADLCPGLICSSTIIDIEHEDENHVGLGNHLISQHVEKIYDTKIWMIEKNSLTFTSIVAAIDDTRYDDLDEWEAASSDLFEMLQFESLAHILNMKYPRSFWTTMTFLFQSLDKGAQKIFILVNVCVGLSIPEEVIDLLYQNTKI